MQNKQNAAFGGMVGSFAAARQAMAGIYEEYKEAEECSPKDFIYDINDLELVEDDQEDEDPHYCFLEDDEKAYLEEWLGNAENFKSLKTLA